MEIERDIQESQEVKIKETPPAKRFRSFDMPRVGVSNFRAGGDIGSSATPTPRIEISWWPRGVVFLQDQHLYLFNDLI